MAGKEALKKLEEELECAICHGTYSDPRLLSCHHAFCSSCLTSLMLEDILTCPTCRKVTPIPLDGLEALQPAFRVNSLLQIHQSLKSDLSFLEEKGSPSASLKSGLSGASLCAEHPVKELKFFCEICKKLFCDECDVENGKHHAHKPIVLEKAAEKIEVEIRASLEPMKKNIADIEDTLGRIDPNSNEIAQQEEQVKADIASAAKQLHEAIDARMSDLCSEVHQRTQAKLKDLILQKCELEALQMTLQHCTNTVEEKLSTNTYIDTIKKKESTITKIESLNLSFDPDILKLIARANLAFSSENANAFCLKYGSLADVDMLDPSKSFIIFKDLGSFAVGEKGTVFVRALDSNGELYEGDIKSLECEFVSELTGASSTISFESKEKSLYELSFVPTVKGMHQLFVKFNGQHISGSPVTVPVEQSIEASSIVKKTPPITTIGDVTTPWGVAINHEGEIVVSEKSKHRISVFSPQGQKLRSFGTEGSKDGCFKKPCGVAVDKNSNIFVADTKNFRLQKFASDGTFLKAVGTKGSGDLQFEKLRDLVYSNFNNRLYVVDGNCIKVLDSDLSFVSTFKKFDSKTKELSMPVGIACDSSGQLYVADCMNNRILVLSSEGEILKVLGGKFQMKKQTFNHPVGVAVDNAGLVYLSQLIYGHNRVSVVTPEGELVKELDGGSGIEWGSIYTPIGLYVDASGVLYVCEFNSDRVVMY